MSSIDVGERVAQISAVRRNSAAGRDELRSAMVAARELRGWLDAQTADLIARLDRVESFAEPIIAEDAKISRRDAHVATERAATIEAVPNLAEALADGRIGIGHIDAVTRAGKRVEPDQRNDLFDRLDALADVAAAASVDQFSDRPAQGASHRCGDR